MPWFRNISDDTRILPAFGVEVAPDGLFEAPDEHADSIERQPWFTPASPPTASKKGDR